MTSTLVDSNVLLDVIGEARTWSAWSASRLAEAAETGTIVINQVVFAETSAQFDDPDAAEAAAFSQFLRESIPWSAAFKAGQAHRAYRNRGGVRERTLPDFLIGAHALTKGYRLLTRDPRRYRKYFPDLDIIAPDTHP
jgi:predicted nucleic acid-binding protein